MSYKKSKIIYALATVLAAVLITACCFPLIACITPSAQVAQAADNYSAVLDDLHTDKAFKESNYPEDVTDYSVSVIQIAEGIHGNLFVYTYQPCEIIKSLVASKINMSLSPDVNLTKLYNLKLVSRDGVFAKYEVEGLTVAADETRYYNISTIYRPFISGVDRQATADKNVRNAIAYPVGQLWTAQNAGDTVKYGVTEIEVVTITSQMIGFRRYSDGFQFANTKTCDAHYIAFTCDHEIDYLLSADIDFKTLDYKHTKGSPVQYGIKQHHSVTLESYQVASNDGSGWFGKREKWHRMTSTSAFIQEAGEISDDEKKELSKYDWILNFYETDYVCDAGGKDILLTLLVPFGFIGMLVDSLTTRGTIVSDVTLLRLEFEYGGEIYNLGVVADTQTGDTKPTNKPEGGSGFDFLAWLKDKGNQWKIIGVAFIAVVVLIIVVLLVVLIKPARQPRESSRKKYRK